MCNNHTVFQFARVSSLYLTLSSSGFRQVPLPNFPFSLCLVLVCWQRLSQCIPGQSGTCSVVPHCSQTWNQPASASQLLRLGTFATTVVLTFYIQGDPMRGVAGAHGSRNSRYPPIPHSLPTRTTQSTHPYHTQSEMNSCRSKYSQFYTNGPTVLHCVCAGDRDQGKLTGE